MATAAQVGASSQTWAFQKLKGKENYHAWAKKMRLALEDNCMWEMVSGKQVISPMVANATPAQQEAYQASVSTWKTTNTQSICLMYSMCEDEPGDKIIDLSTAAEAWATLKNHYTSTYNVNRFSKLQDLLEIRPDRSDNSVETYVAKIRSKAEELEEIGYPLEEWVVVGILLMNLGSKYREFVSRLLTSGREDLPFDELVPLLYEEECLLKRENKAQAMAAAMKNKKPSKGHDICEGNRNNKPHMR